MIPLFGKYDINMFYNYLNNATNYLEYGSGGSTYQASLRINIVNIYSMESDYEWYTKINKLITNSHVKLIYNEMCSKPNTWGNPGHRSTLSQHIRYSSLILTLNKSDAKKIDLILIDGRFRVACCLKCFDVINDNCFIIFDDFLNREYYHIVLDYFYIREQTADNRMVVLQKKPNVNSPSEQIIQTYEKIPH
jgi:hypothetical protein